MIRPTGTRAFSDLGGRWLRLLLVAGALQLGGPALDAFGGGRDGSRMNSPAALRAQEPALADSVAVRELEYRREYAAWEAAVSAVRVAENQLGTAIAMIESAQRTGNDDALDEAQRIAQSRALENQRLDHRVRDRAERLEAARQRLLEAMDARLVFLQTRLLAAATAAEQDRIDALVEDLQIQYRELEQAAEVSGIVSPPGYYPAASPDPRDGPSEWRIKAGLLERRAEVVETQLTDARETLGRLNDRLRLQRTRADARAARDRFGDAQPPVSAAANPGERGAELVTDTTGVPVDQLPLEQQIAVWEAYIGQLETFRDQLLAQAGLFRGWLTRRGGVAGGQGGHA